MFVLIFPESPYSAVFFFPMLATFPSTTSCAALGACSRNRVIISYIYVVFSWLWDIKYRYLERDFRLPPGSSAIGTFLFSCFFFGTRLVPIRHWSGRPTKTWEGGGGTGTRMATAEWSWRTLTVCPLSTCLFPKLIIIINVRIYK